MGISLAGYVGVLSLIALPLIVFILLIYIGWRNNNKLNKGEMRRAIAASFVTAFLVLLPLSLLPTATSGLDFSSSSFVNFFLGVVATIIGFYFGSKMERELLVKEE